MPVKLFASRYDDVSYSGADAAETFDAISDVGIRWSLPGGVQRIELMIKAKSKYDAYDRYQNHLGHRIAIYDSFCDSYIGGQVFEIVPDGRYVLYICAGPWKRTYDDEYGKNDMGDVTPTDDTDVIVKDILDDRVTISNADQSNIDGSGVASGAWAGEREQQISTPPGEAFTELAQIGDSSNNPMDFYFVDAPFSGAQMQKPLPYFKSRSTIANPDWQFSVGDLVSGGLSLARNIWNLTRSYRSYYGRLGGTHDGGDNLAILDDSTADFRGKVVPGDRAINLTQAFMFTVETVDNATQISFSPEAHAGDWDDDDIYVIFLSKPAPGTIYTSTETDLWARVARDAHPGASEAGSVMDVTQANEYAQQYLAIYEKPQQQQSFVIGSPTIMDGNGASWSLHRPLMGNSFYFRAKDIFPEAALFSTSDDRSQAFMAVAMDYTHRNSRLRVVPSTGDSRLDVLLNQARIAHGQLISTATDISNRPLPPPPEPTGGSGRGHRGDRHIPDPGGKGRGRDRAGDIAPEDWEAEGEGRSGSERYYWYDYL